MALAPELQEFTTASQQLVNYTWQEFSSNTAYTNFYCGAATDSVGTTYFLTTETIEGNPIYVQLNNATSSDLDFDYEFKEPTTINGTAILNFSQFGGTASGGTTAITVYHVAADTTETSIGSATSATRAGTDAALYRETLKISLTKKNFAVGEKLRINAIFSHTGGNAGQLYFDPASALTKTDILGRTVGIDFICRIPFNTNQ